MDLKEINAISKNISKHWYYRSKATALTSYIESLEPKFVLDVGAGSGFFCEHLLGMQSVVEGLCVDTAYSEENVKIIGDKRISYTRELVDSKADLVLMMDVLEHVENDSGLLHDVSQCVEVGTSFFITVPAFDFLWSKHDEFLGHKRRYDLETIQRTVKESGLNVLKANYFFASVLPVAAMVRMAKNIFGEKSPTKSDMSEQPFLFNNFLTWICCQEAKIINSNKWFGLSVLCLAQKV